LGKKDKKKPEEKPKDQKSPNTEIGRSSEGKKKKKVKLTGSRLERKEGGQHFGRAGATTNQKKKADYYTKRVGKQGKNTEEKQAKKRGHIKKRTPQKRTTSVLQSSMKGGTLTKMGKKSKPIALFRHKI